MKTANGIKISPRAQRRLKSLRLNPVGVKGSGPGGRIVEADLRGAKPGSKASPMRQAIAKLTSQSFSTVPHFYLRAEMDATALVKLRTQMLDQIQRETGVKVTITDFILRAMALALKAMPEVNQIWQNDNVVSLPQNDIGMVVGLSEGLLIPVIAQADQLSFSALVRRRAGLTAAAREGKLPAEALKTHIACSLSNLGSSRVDEFAAIIPPPQSSILAVGRIAARPYVVEGQLAVRQTVKLCLSVDHRVLDGTQAGGFLGKVIELLEQPTLLL
jgi:pyruvate dehydrogenase E2 component (dihydrolipoamide acetyltransferase)